MTLAKKSSSPLHCMAEVRTFGDPFDTDRSLGWRVDSGRLTATDLCIMIGFPWRTLKLLAFEIESLIW